MATTSAINNSTASSAVKNTDPDTGDVTVTSLTAKTFNPGQATATVIKNQEGLLYSLWRVVLFLLFEALGLNKSADHKGIHEDYEHANLDEVAARGKFPHRPSDLFLKVQIKVGQGLNIRCSRQQWMRLIGIQKRRFVRLHFWDRVGWLH
jgi:hypothetical protein